MPEPIRGETKALHQSNIRYMRNVDDLGPCGGLPE